MTDSLCIDDDIMLLSALTVRNDFIDQRLLIAVIPLWKKNILCTVGDAAPQSNISCITSITSMILQRSWR